MQLCIRRSNTVRTHFACILRGNICNIYGGHMKNTVSRTDSAWTNLRWSAAGILFSLIFGSFSRKMFVAVLGREYVGFSSLIGNICALLSLLDFGASGAAIYSLYEPLAKNDMQTVSRLLACYRRVCTFSAFATAVAGIAVMPYLPKDVPGGKNTVCTVFIIYIISNSLSFMFSAERVLIFADSKNYLAAMFSYACGIPAVFAEYLLLTATKSYVAYVIFHAAVSFAEDMAFAVYVRKKYSFINFSEKAQKGGIFQKLLKEMLYSQPTNIASTLLRTFDNFLVVSLFGVGANGVYSNYNMLLSYASMLSSTLAGAISACVGNLGVCAEKKHSEKVFRALSVGLFFAVNICTTVLFVMSDDIITLWLGAALSLPDKVSFSAAFFFFVSGLRKSTLIFRDAFGLYKKERIKPFIELAGFLLLTAIFGKRFGIAGVYLGQALSSFAVCLWYEPRVLYKYGFHSSVLRHYTLMIKFCTVCAASCFSSFLLCRAIPRFSLRCAVCCAVPCILFAAAFWGSDELCEIISVGKKIFFKQKASKKPISR